MENISNKIPTDGANMEGSTGKLNPMGSDVDTLLTGWKEYFSCQTSLNHDNKNMLSILPDILKLQNEKERVYGRSWCKHGDLSAFFNLERKWDRIQNIMERAMKEGTDTLFSAESGTPTETILDTIIDLGCYSIMWAGYIKERYPELFEQFKAQNGL